MPTRNSRTSFPSARSGRAAASATAVKTRKPSISPSPGGLRLASAAAPVRVAHPRLLAPERLALLQSGLAAVFDRGDDVLGDEADVRKPQRVGSLGRHGLAEILLGEA